MKIRLKRLLNKYKNRILSFIVVFAFVPLFAFNSFAYTVYNNYPYDLGGLYFYTDVTGNVVTETKTDSNKYIFNNSSFSSNHFQLIMDYQQLFYNIPVDVSVYDYYIVSSVVGLTESIDNFTFFPTSFNVAYRDHNNDDAFYNLSDINFYHCDTNNYKGFSVSAKIDMSSNTSIRLLSFNSSVSGTLPNNIVVEIMVVSLPKGISNGDVQQAIVSAINNQTSTLGGKIDDTNNFIDKGNSSTSGIVSGNNSAIGQLDEVVSEYHATEQQFFDDFNTNQQAITSDIVGWSWGGLVNCANWVGDTMTDYYNNMGDFRQYIIYPLMLGIVLFFLGRGGSIIGHLFRKPTETTVNTKSVFRREGNTRYTTTTTTRQGGVWRK